MSQFSASWRVALRAGRRDVLRSKGRSALIVTMVGTPVLLTVILTTLVASNSISMREGLPDELGHAQASAHYQGGRVVQSPDTRSLGTFDDTATRLTVVEQKAKLAKITTGSVLPVERGWNATVVIDGKGYSSQTLGLDAARPATAGMYRVEEGRVPGSADEVLVSSALAERGAAIGTSVKVNRDTELRVVGVGRIGSVARGGDPQQVLVLPGVLPATDGTNFLIDRASAVTWADVQELNRAGFSVVSRHVLDHPSSVGGINQEDADLISSSDDAATRAVLVIVVTAIVLEVVLLAGPAFAVGVRRQRRDHALLAATGASPDQIRRVVLGQALVLGMLACVLGALIGIGLSALIVWIGPSVVPKLAFGPFELQWGYIVAAIVLGSLAAMGAAFVPAKQASKQEVAAVLAGRRGTVRSSRGWPAVGLVLIAVGLVVCFTQGARAGGEIAVAMSTIAIVLGTVLLTPVIIGMVSGIGGALPLPLRLAVRDTARQRARSAPAIAAIMASVAAVTTLAIGSSSDFEQSRQEYQYLSAMDRMIIWAEPAALTQAMAAAKQASGGTDFTPLGTAGTESMDGNGVSVYPATSDGYSGPSELVVGDAATIEQWGVRLTAEQRSALASGRALVGDARALKDGKLVLDVAEGENDHQVTVDAVLTDLGVGKVPVGPEPTIGFAVLSPAAMKDLKLPWEARSAITALDSAAPSKAVGSRVKRAVSGVDPQSGGAYVERGFHESFALPFLALLGFGVVAVMVGTMTATGLALSDARPDFSTLAAIGAAPRMRRLVAGSQAVVLATLGTLLGIAVGFAPGIAVTWPLTTDSYAEGVARGSGPIISVPWLLLGAMLVVIPLLAGVTALLFTRSKIPIVRRLAQ